MKKSIITLSIAACVVLLYACKKDEPAKQDPPSNNNEKAEVHVHLEAATGHHGDPLVLGKTYATNHGDSVRLDQVRYWLSNIELERLDGTTWKEEDSYRLIENTDLNVREMFNFEVPTGTYTKMRFSIGVHANQNFSLDSIQGELSANVGMSWTWNTGYIFNKTEGSFLHSDSGSYQPFLYHIGTDANYKTVEITFPAPFELKNGKELHGHILYKVLNLFDTPNVMDLKQHPVLKMSPMDQTANVAENYSKAFEIHHLEVE